MYILHKAIAFYNKALHWLAQPFPALLLFFLTFFAIFHKGILSNIAFFSIFVFFFLLFAVLLHYKFKEKINIISDGKYIIAVNPILMEGVYVKAAQVVGSLTKGQAAGLFGGAIAVGAVAEIATNAVLADGAEKSAQILEDRAEKQDKDGLPYNAQLFRCKADIIRVEEALRPPGGHIVQGLYNNINSILNAEVIAERRKTLSEEVESFAVPARMEMDHRNKELERGFARIEREEELKDRRDERDLDENERRRSWEGRDLFSKAHTHLSRATSTVDEFSKGLVEIEGEGSSRSHLVTAAGIKLLQIVTARVEIQHMDNPFLGDNFPKKSTTLLFPQDKISEKIQSSTEFEEKVNETIGAYYQVEEPEKEEETSSPVLKPAQPLSKDFLEELDKYHKDLSKSGSDKDN